MSTLDRLEADYESRRLCISQYIMYRAWRVFDPSKLPPEYALPFLEARLYRKSATAIIREIRENWEDLNSETQNAFAFVFKRPTDVGGGDDQKQHLLPRLFNTTNFVIHWTDGTDGGSKADAVPSNDDNASGIPDYIEDMGESFEKARSFEVVNRGFQAPPSDAAEPNDANRRNPDQKYDIFVYNMTDGGYGYTQAEDDSIPSYSFIAVDNDYLGYYSPQLQSVQVTAAHEFFHAIQFCYPFIASTNVEWWMEATSTYMEDEVYPDVNDNYQYLQPWFELCDLFGLETFNHWHEYGTFIFAKYLSEVFEDDVIKQIWEQPAATSVIAAINSVLVGRGSSLLNEFNWFTIANFFLEDLYADGTDYRKGLAGKTTFNGVWLQYEYNASLEADYVVIDNSNVARGMTWMDVGATDYVTIELDPNIKNYRVFFDGLDPTTDYLVTKAYKKDGAILREFAVLDEQKDDYFDISYDPTVENLTLIISNVGAATTNPSLWRIIITKLLPQMMLSYDDGTMEASLNWDQPKCKFAVGFTPTTTGRLTECSFYIDPDYDWATVKVHVMDKSRNDLSVVPPFYKTPAYAGWIHVDLSKFQVTVSQGVDFYIAIETTIAKAPSLGVDQDSPDGRSWLYNGQKWSQFPALGLPDMDLMIRAIVATETPDLTISDISWTPSIPIEGNTVTFTANIKNRGPINAGSFKVAYYIDGSKIGEWSISSLSAGQNINKTFTWTAVQGNHTVKASADSSYNIDEKVEINNEREKTLNVAPKPKPDLTISDISWVPETPANGATVTFTVTIKNNGTANAASFKTAYYINETKQGEWSITSLSVGQEVNKTFTWTYVEGSHIVKAFADSNGEIPENDETNNQREEIIGNLPPEASFTCNGRDCLSNPIAYVRKSTYFNATESYDPDGSIVSFSWDFGDDSVTTVTDPIITHNYTLIGNYKVTLNVTDNMGMWHTATGDVTVKLKCDLNNDKVVNVVDITVVSVAFSSRPGDPNWNPNVDFDNDGRITIIDITVVTIEFGSRA